MKRFQGKDTSVEKQIDIPSNEEGFKPFRETYKIISFYMIVGQLYPNPETDRQRVICIVMATVSVIPMSVLISLDAYGCWQRGDIVKIIRHVTVLGPLSFTLFKMLLFYIRRDEARRIIDTIDSDHSTYNNLPEHHKAIARNGIKQIRYYSQYRWACIVASSVLTFPLTAVLLNVYNHLFMSEPVLYMVHDVDKPFSAPEDRFTSPYFEFMFAYMTYCAFVYILSYTGFDAFFGITTSHICLKIELLCAGMDDAMLETHPDTRFKKMVDVIQQHNEVFKLVDLVQETYNIWLGVILIGTVAQICNCLYQVIEGYGIDPRYLVFILATAVHIYMPCRYAAILQATAAQVSNRAYCSGWERSGDLRARRMAAFIIARAQIPITITAFNVVEFDMELFVSLMQKSYSLFTLLRP